MKGDRTNRRNNEDYMNNRTNVYIMKVKDVESNTTSIGDNDTE